MTTTATTAPPDAAEKTRAARWNVWGVVLAVAALVGIALRVRPYVGNRALWVDEAMLALNLAGRSFAELLEPLDMNQAAPVGFLWASKLVTIVLGRGEYALRLVPLLTGVASVILFAVLARRHLPARGAAITAILFAVSEPLIYYASELKPYGPDVFFTLAILLATDAARMKGGTMRWAALAVLGAVAVWCSYSAIFVLAGVGVALLAGEVTARAWRRAGVVTIVGIAWLVSFGLAYLAFLRHSAGNDFLERYWTRYFVPFSNGPKALIDWFIDQFFYVFENPGGLPASGLAAALFLIGFVTFARDRGRRLALAMLCLPIAFALLAAALHIYPFRGRLLLFIVPLLLVLVAAGAERLWEWAGSRSIVAPLVLCVLLVRPAQIAARYALNPPGVEELPKALAYVRDRRKDGDVMYLYWGGRRPYLYYAPRYPLPGVRVVQGVRSQEDLTGYLRDLEQLHGEPRVWVVISHVQESQGINEERFITLLLARAGKQLDHWKTDGAAVYLYDLSAAPAPATAPAMGPARAAGATVR